MVINNTVSKDGTMQKVIAKEAGCSRGLWPSTLVWSWKEGKIWYKKRCRAYVDNNNLERTVKRFKKKWGSQSFESHLRCFQDLGYNCQSSFLKPEPETTAEASELGYKQKEPCCLTWKSRPQSLEKSRGAQKPSQGSSFILQWNQYCVKGQGLSWSKPCRLSIGDREEKEIVLLSKTKTHLFHVQDLILHLLEGTLRLGLL